MKNFQVKVVIQLSSWRCLHGGLLAMVINATTLIIWLLISALVGFVGELLARRRAPDGLLGAIILGFLAILLIVGVFHFRIVGEPILYGCHSGRRHEIQQHNAGFQFLQWESAVWTGRSFAERNAMV